MSDTPHIGLGTIVRGLGWDIGLPLVAYYVLHFAGASDWVALLAGSLAAGARILLVAARDRSWNLFATVIMVSFLVGLGLAFVSGDPRFLLLKESFVTGAIGLCFIVTTAMGRPLTLAAAQMWSAGHGARMADDFATDPAVRRGHRICSLVWGFGLLTEALVRIPLVYLVPVSVMVGLSTAMAVAVFGGLGLWTVRYIRGAGRSAAEAGAGSVPAVHEGR